VPHKQLTTSLADIHGIYQGPRPSSGSSELPTHKRMPLSSRDTDHPGSPPARPPVKSKGKP
jgi:hypothetical protein